MAKVGKTWPGEIIEYKNFRDLGNYVIELPDYTDPKSMERGIALLNDIADRGELPERV